MAKRVLHPLSVPVALMIVQAQTLTIEWCNEYMYVMAEMFTDQEIVGHPIGEFLPLDQVPEAELAINNAADTGEPAFLEGEVVGPDGVMSIFTSIYRIPGGRILIAAWHPSPVPIRQTTDPVGTVRPAPARVGSDEPS
jgi:hypothetical protein